MRACNLGGERERGHSDGGFERKMKRQEEATGLKMEQREEGRG